ncbi:MAG: hypothetical protein JO112_01200, partial [Planctomycetes bacterium]|nr:hypothetical protein [Planctomycetota bacterium]
MEISSLPGTAGAPCSRRQMLQLTGALALGLTDPELLPSSACLAAYVDQPGPLPALNRFPRMVQEYFVGQVRQAEQQGNALRAALRTKAEAEAYVRLVRDKIRRCFGPEPERTPLRARTTGVVERDAYRIEKILFESRPDFLVSANLY